ncbi:MAG TPA: hypothetical protein VGS22_02495 [Thermoanaerobaculia bacterium]|jgi:hypothetical protein|nr:hypothetical protein [Thermoanaerobaculia bacterium]
MSSPTETSFDNDDDVIAQVRAARHRISERFDHDPYRLVAYYMERQKDLTDRLVKAPETEVEAIPALAGRHHDD